MEEIADEERIERMETKEGMKENEIYFEDEDKEY